MSVNKIKAGKHIAACFVALSTGFLAGPAEVWPLQDGENPNFEMVVQNRHSRQVESVSFSPDGKYIVSGSKDTTIKLWDKEGILLRTFEGHSNEVNSVSFSPDGKHIVSGAMDKTIKLWGIDGRLIKTFKGHSGSVRSVSFSPDGKHIVSGSWDKTIKLWGLDEKLIRTFEGYSNWLNSVSFSPDGKNIVSGSWTDTIKLWNLDGKLIRTFEYYSSGGGSVSFSPDGNHLVSGGLDNTIKLWDIKGRLIKTLKGHSDGVTSVAFSPDGTHIVSGSHDKTLKLWGLDGKLIRTFEGHSNWVNSVSFSPDGQTVVSGSWDNTIKLWNLEGKPTRIFEGYSGWVGCVSFSPDGKYIASGANDKTIKLWGIEGKLIGTFEGHSDGVKSVLFSPDGKYIVSGSADKTVKLWNIEGNLVRTFKGHSGWVRSVSVSPDGKYIVSGSADKTVKLWNIEGNLVRTFKGHSNMVESVAFSPDGKHIASGSEDKTIRLWSIEGRLIRIFKGHPGGVGSISFSLDGKHIASDSNMAIKIWGLEGNLVRIFKGHSDWVLSVSFSPDGKHIVSSSWDKTIKLWGLDGTLIKTFEPFWVTGAVFSPDGKYIASGSPDGAIKLWNIHTGECFSSTGRDNDWIMYTPDGYFDASPHGGELVAMVKGMEAFGVDQFAVRNNRPDLILERMGLGTPEQITHYNLLYQKRLKKAGLTEADLSSELHAPEAKITGTTQTGKFINIAFSFSDSKYPLQRYNIYVNDVPLFGSSGKEISGKSFKGTEKIELTAGKNKIEFSAMNNAGAESYRALTYADYGGKEKGALYYLAFGASKYKDAKLSLNYADKDVKDLETVISKMRPAYTDIHVKTFLNNEVTPENIKKAKDFLKDAKTDDTVILAIAGHGGYSKGSDPKYYYVAYETDVNKLASTGVDFDSIEDLLDDIKPRKKLFLMDTCESGELDENVYENYYALADARGFKPRTYRKPLQARGTGSKGRSYLHEKDRFIYNDLARRTGAVVFSSSKGGEISYESSALQNGFFTKEIINALTSKAADKNNDGKIDSGELRDFVSDAVAKGTGGLQHPTIDRDNLYQKIELPLVFQ